MFSLKSETTPSSLYKWSKHLVFNTIDPPWIFIHGHNKASSHFFPLPAWVSNFDSLNLFTNHYSWIPPRDLFSPPTGIWEWVFILSFFRMFQTPSELLLFFQFFIASLVLLEKSPGLGIRISEGHDLSVQSKKNSERSVNIPTHTKKSLKCFPSSTSQPTNCWSNYRSW